MDIPATSDAIPGTLVLRDASGNFAGGGELEDGDKGDITVSGSGSVWTIDNQAVSYSKIQNVSTTDRVLGRSSSGAGTIEEIICTAAGRALIDDASATDQRTTLGLGSAALSSTTDFASASSLTTIGNSASVSNELVRRDASGNFAANTITATLNGVATSVSDGAVTLAKLASEVIALLVPVGTVHCFVRNSAPSGWLEANGSTLGSASSGATNASNSYEDLFTVLWSNGWTDANLPILTSGGAASTRGASASDDWSANKRITIPDLRGIFIRGSGSQTFGSETYAGTFGAKQNDNIQSHTHTVTDGGASFGTTPAQSGSGVNAATSLSSTSRTTSPAGSGTETHPSNISLLYCIKF